jgi:hypothetical protein
MLAADRALAAAPDRHLAAALVGRSFVHPVLEYLLVGGLLSLVATVVLVAMPHPVATTGIAFATVLLASNSAHFAASTVRLYSKPGSFQTWPILTMVFPLVAILVLIACVASPLRIGTHLQSLYLTWSPYHYAAQAYGLAVVYAYRSGCKLAPRDKKFLWWVAMLPFFYAFLTAPGAGLFWFVSKEQLQSVPIAAGIVRGLVRLLPIVGIVAPVWLFVKVWRAPSGPMPLMSLACLVTNGVWWFALTAMQAFFWATVFHGLQYLVIAAIFHVREQLQQPVNRHGAAWHTVWFYGASLLLGYALFHTLPWAFTLAGFGMVESMLLVIAAINVHHFVVDAYIWRLRPGDSNRRVVETNAAPETAAPVSAPALA